ncbi:hypothetical protein B6V73_00075 [Thioclava sp. JM3]|uniref:hypothetical protein n=1 Tax=Thioclava sp. JM3 TaxID=1973004 RepID=UPI000B53E3C3|nr:hypothetical protein [Thioclava sp. JM3]OWY18252.1 hypothetical protein B6V73_00075 [Thioclava sp. JM3]
MSDEYDSRRRLAHIEQLAERRHVAVMKASDFKNGIATTLFALRRDLAAIEGESRSPRGRVESEARAKEVRKEIAELEAERPAAEDAYKTAQAEWNAAQSLADACRKFAEEKKLPLPLKFDSGAQIDNGLPVVNVRGGK